MEKLKSICLQYAAVTQWLITSSIDIPKTDAQSNTSHETKKSKLVKRRNPSQKLKLASEDKSLVEPILYVIILALVYVYVCACVIKCVCMCACPIIYNLRPYSGNSKRILPVNYGV